MSLLAGTSALDEIDSSPGISAWDSTVNLRASSGYKDNLALGNTITEGSPFFSAGLELILWRLPIDGTQFSFFLSAEDVRYPFARTLDKEQTLLAHAQLKKDFGNGWSSALTLQYLYQDQVLDLSTTENLGAIKVQGHSFTGRSSVRRDLAKENWGEMELSVNRQNFLAPLDDYWEGGPKISFGHQYGDHSELSLSYEFSNRAYDHRLLADPDGNRVAGTRLAYYQHEAALALRHYWGPKRRWRSTTKLAYQHTEDSGSGYFNFGRYRFSQQLRFRAGGWEFNGQLKVSYYQYPIQTVSETDPTRRRRTDLSFGLRGEKAITKAMKVFADYQYEIAMSNQEFDRYEVNTVSAGVDWEF